MIPIQSKFPLERVDVFISVCRSVGELKNMSVAVDNNAMINNIATISANNDAFIGGLISEAYDKIGLNGLLTIEDSKTVETYIEVLEGAEIPCGWTAKEFVTDNDKMLTVYENPNIMVLDYEVKSFKQLEPILNKISASDAVSTPLIIVARGFDGEPFNTMVVNRVRNKIPVCLVKAPTAYQKESFIDLAALTGANVICDEAGLKIENTELSDFGTCKKIIISNKNTLIIGGNTNKEAIEQIKHEIGVQRNDTSNDLLKEILDNRVARLTGSVAVIYVGG